MGGIAGNEDTRIEAELTDVFSGKKALRAGAAQRFNPDIKGWDFSIVEKPKEGEYRYLRFAWKKVGDGPLMIQFCSRDPQDWGHRYHAGGSPPWTARELYSYTPGDWMVVTRDLYKDFGAFRVGGVAFTPLHGGDGLFDHVLLGRTIADLDRVTAKILRNTPPREPLAEPRLKQLLDHLGHADESIAETAVWALVRGHKEGIPFLLSTVKIPDRKRPLSVDEAKVKPLVEGLTHYRHLTRQSAAEELFRLGDGVLPHLRRAAAVAEGEAKIRLTAFVDGWAARTGLDELRLRRCATVLRIVDTPEGRELLARIEKVLP